MCFTVGVISGRDDRPCKIDGSWNALERAALPSHLLINSRTEKCHGRSSTILSASCRSHSVEKGRQWV